MVSASLSSALFSYSGQASAEQLLFTIGLGGESSVVTSSAKITGTVSGVQLTHAYGERISHLEEQVATRQAEVAELKQQMTEFRKQFE
jgi:hypothetical protein